MLDALMHLARGGVEHIGVTLRPDEDWAPVLLMTLGEDHDPVVVGVAELFIDGSGLFIELVPPAMRARGATAAVLVTTTWMVSGSGALTDSTRPSEHPDRQEALTVVGVDSSGATRMVMLPIVRQLDSHPTLGAPLDHCGADLAGGVYAALRYGVGAT